MKGTIEYNMPGEKFWKDYRELWINSVHPSAFQAPRFIKKLIEHHAENTIAVFKFYSNQKLRAAAFFTKSNNEFKFLSDLRTDHNYFIIHGKRTKDEVKAIFKAFVDQIASKKWPWTLNYHPTWSAYAGCFRQTLKNSDLFYEQFNYSVCPVLEMDSSKDIEERFTRSKNILRKLAKLQKHFDVDLETLSDTSDLDQWIDGFVDAHMARWANTKTPSEFHDPANKVFLKKALLAWHKDGILVRFSIKTEQGRIAYAIALVEGNTLLHHSHTYDINYSQYSPGLIMMYIIGKYMGANGLKKLDFGDGNEPYKYNYANNELVTDRIYISQTTNIPFILKTKLIKLIRQNKIIYEFYTSKIKPLLSS